MAKVLICEPYKNLRRLYAYELRAEGYEVELAADVDEAMVKLALADADLVVMDIPARSLHKAREMAAALRRRSGTPMILNTAHGSSFHDLLSVPADARLIKSCDLGELKQKISELLSRSRLPKEVEVCA
jgi:DNA-binding response OmpR family regulator